MFNFAEDATTEGELDLDIQDQTRAVEHENQPPIADNASEFLNEPTTSSGATHFIIEGKYYKQCF